MDPVSTFFFYAAPDPIHTVLNKNINILKTVLLRKIKICDNIGNPNASFKFSFLASSLNVVNSVKLVNLSNEIIMLNIILQAENRN